MSAPTAALFKNAASFRFSIRISVAGFIHLIRLAAGEPDEVDPLQNKKKQAPVSLRELVLRLLNIALEDIQPSLYKIQALLA